MPINTQLCFESQTSELYSKFPLRACSPGGYFSTLSSEYQHADIVAKHSMCLRFDVCMLISVCFCARMNTRVMAQLGADLSLVGYNGFGGLFRFLCDHL